MEAINQDYAAKGVQFFYIYKALAHPETNGYVAPVTLDERLLHVREAQAKLGTKITWLCDSMENELKHALGDAPNSEFILDPAGRVLVKRGWSKPDELRQDLEKLIGPIERPTTIASLNLPAQKWDRQVATGVMKRLEVPNQFRPLIVETIKSDGEPFYVKLRVEAEPALLSTGEGKLYLGFQLDPLYHVHWNNLAAPLKYEFVASAAATVQPSAAQAGKPEVESDGDPREFLVDVTLLDRSKPLELKVDYFACHDEENWCKPVSQSFRILLEVDQDGGTVRRGGNSNRQAAADGPGSERHFERSQNRPSRPGSRPRRGTANLPENRPIPGRIISIDAVVKSITVQLSDGSEVEYNIGDARLMDAEGSIQIEDLRERDRVMVGTSAEKDSEGRVVVRRLMRR
ncbi:MAG: hypothetical protein JNL67_23145 [Planctomycetaceae bacterium]|nr:hypothetical protein [Planctomycetaceae bacterium]